jgi:hypothetical protein
MATAMTNEIETVREKMKRVLESARLCPDEGFNELSPCGRYLLEVEAYAPAEVPNYSTIAVATVRSAVTREVVVTLNRNDTRCFYAWVTRDEHDYLLFAEDLEGHSVIDLTARRVEGFSSPDDQFIWAEIHPSPDRMWLAVVGCYWACSYEVAVYDFHDPLRLPLPVVARFELPDSGKAFEGWVTDRSFRLEGVARVIELPG